METLEKKKIKWKRKGKEIKKKVRKRGRESKRKKTK